VKCQGMFTGTLIEDLFTAVERAEQAARSDEQPIPVPQMDDSWLVSLQQNSEYDSKLFGVA